jgi:RES domain-containing protein
MLSPPPSKGNFTLITIRIGVDMVGDLRSPERIRAVGLTSEIIGQPDFAPCPAEGSAARWLKMGGLLVLSARRKDADNLVIFPDVDDSEFEVFGSEPTTA